MTEDDIIDMAKEADIYANCEWEHSKNPKQWKQCRDEYFADLLTSTEREACALLAQQFGPTRPIVAVQPSERIKGRWEGEQAASAGIADAIRARSQS